MKVQCRHQSVSLVDHKCAMTHQNTVLNYLVHSSKSDMGCAIDQPQTDLCTHDLLQGYKKIGF
jgi:hypothetical protein